MVDLLGDTGSGQGNDGAVAIYTGLNTGMKTDTVTG